MGMFSRRKKAGSVIDLVDIERQLDAKRRPELVWGLPSLCPECHAPGYLDRIDPGSQTMFQHCPDCFHKWELTRAEIEEANQQTSSTA